MENSQGIFANTESDDFQFEKDLFYSLKYYGYLFPTSVNEINKFEEHFGKTEVNIPDNLKNFNNILDLRNHTDHNDFDINFDVKMAAISSEENDTPYLSDDDSDQISDEDRPEIKPE